MHLFYNVFVIVPPPTNSSDESSMNIKSAEFVSTVTSSSAWAAEFMDTPKVELGKILGEQKANS